VKELIDFIARTLVDQPERVEVAEHADDRVLELRVADEDLGRIIGRRGKTARAMRTVVTAASPDRWELEISEGADSDEGADSE
jgi:predicted RNA-binding protein YlqC (UPF0109 family)